jgi:transcriptional repressor NrdR
MKTKVFNHINQKRGIMNCLFCANEETKVLESRIVDDSMRRRRECLKCANRFTTYERASFSLMVIKKDGREQPFDQQKIVASLERACGKVDEATIQSLSRQVQQKVLRKKSNRIRSQDIGKYVLQILKKFDKISYLRFATIYKEIEDPKVLEKELKMLA